ncbi:hypothetical protein AWB77_05087 [Caballeronia fortuita]|uniref:Glycosyltransferase RgtA/B/C/D-like domain-containing protein n=1 Tax=Caballeronia fortuita TaxID=1777138 RepID=A0A158DAB0_9BURK|nr:hypothetical protein [Caballeronia fortuita]SAK91300.1 hypothetical protein AWB77_05087 [Caballeronia fortuita]
MLEGVERKPDDPDRIDLPSVAMVLAILAIGAAIACVFGFVSNDSWDYLLLAQSLRRGLGCTENGTYFATFPCGYPLAIALLSPFSDIPSIFVSSKILNFALLFLAFVFLALSPLRIGIAALVALNPLSLRIYQYTWSENLFLFAVAGSFACIAAVHRNGRSGWHGVLLAAALVIGCSSRYVFGPFAALMFVCVALVWGRRTAIRVLPSFAFAALFYWAYQTFNVQHTGFSTGMARIPAPESTALLIYTFVHASVRIVSTFCATAAIFIVLAGARFKRAVIDEERARANWFLVLLGAGALLLQFALRVRTQFDPFDARTLGYGYVFLLSGAAGLFTQLGDKPVRLRALVIYGLTCVLLAQGPGFALRLLRIPRDAPVPAIADMRTYRSAPTDATLIVSLVTPRVNATIEGESALYYPPGKEVVSPGTAPYRTAETFAAFRARVLVRHIANCAIDFTPFASAEQFREYLDATYPVDLRLRPKLSATEFIRRDSLDPTMRDWLRTRFAPGRYVDCGL